VKQVLVYQLILSDKSNPFQVSFDPEISVEGISPQGTLWEGRFFKSGNTSLLMARPKIFKHRRLAEKGG